MEESLGEGEATASYSGQEDNGGRDAQREGETRSLRGTQACGFIVVRNARAERGRERRRRDRTWKAHLTRRKVLGTTSDCSQRQQHQPRQGPPCHLHAIRSLR